MPYFLVTSHTSSSDNTPTRYIDLMLSMVATTVGEDRSSEMECCKVEINNGGQIPGSKELAIMGDEKRESMKVRFKTGANSTSPNAKQLEESNIDRRTQQGSNAVKRLKE